MKYQSFKVGVMVSVMVIGLGSLTFSFKASALIDNPNDPSLIDTSPDDTTPPANVTMFTALGLDSQIRLSWVNPKDADFVRTLIIRKVGSAPLSRTDGTSVYEGVGTSFVDTQLVNGTTYYYTAYSFDNVPNYASGVTVSATPQSGKTQTQILASTTPVAINQNPNSTSSLTQVILPSPASSEPEIQLVNQGGTYFIVNDGVKYGVTSPSILSTYGLSLSDAKPAQDSDKTLPSGNPISPGDGSLVKSSQDPTIYLISNQKRYPFTSGQIFTKLGFKFSSVLQVTNPELQSLPSAPIIDSGEQAHLPGVDISHNGVVYWVAPDNTLQAYSSVEIYNTWHNANDFSKVVPANAADLTMPVSGIVSPRSKN